jgi:hypothetical protein
MTSEELLSQAEQNILKVLKRHDPQKFQLINGALDVAHQQICYAIHLRSLIKKDPIVQMHQQLKEMPLLDGKSMGAGEKDDND